MSVPPFNELFLDVLKLANTKKEYKPTELSKELEDVLDLTEEDRKARIKSGSSVFENTVSNSRSDWLYVSWYRVSPKLASSIRQ